MANYGARPYPWQKSYNFNHKKFMIDKELFNQLKKAIKEAPLSPREYKIIDMRFGLTSGIPHTLEKVGNEFGVTRERIRQIEAKTIEKLKSGGWIIEYPVVDK